VNRTLFEVSDNIMFEVSEFDDAFRLSVEYVTTGSEFVVLGRLDSDIKMLEKFKLMLQLEPAILLKIVGTCVRVMNDWKFTEPIMFITLPI
jgi:hypothetical protein